MGKARGYSQHIQCLGLKVCGHTGRQPDKQADGQTERQRDRQAGKQTDKQTDRQTGTSSTPVRSTAPSGPGLGPSHSSLEWRTRK